MLKRALYLCIVLMTLHQGVNASDLILTVEADKSSYPPGETATFTGTLKNVSQVTVRTSEPVDYCFYVIRSGVQVWGWSNHVCG